MARIELPWIDDDTTTIKIPSKAHPAGKDYTFPAPDIDTGVRLTALAELGLKSTAGRDLTEDDLARIDLNDDQEFDLYRDLMGDTLDEMRADGVSWTRVQKVGRYLFLLHGLGEDMAAEAVARSSTGGALPPANRGQRRAAKKSAKKSTRTASPAGSTSRPARKG